MMAEEANRTNEEIVLNNSVLYSTSLRILSPTCTKKKMSEDSKSDAQVLVDGMTRLLLAHTSIGVESKPLVDRVNDAIEFAKATFGDKTRNDGKLPYVFHPLSVAAFLACLPLKYFDDNKITFVNVCIAAVLHDTVEDTDVTFDEIKERFGDDVAKWVSEVTHDKTKSKTQQRKEELETIGSKSKYAQMIRMADCIDNLSSLPTSGFSPAGKQAYVTRCNLLLEAMKDNECEPLKRVLKTKIKECQ